MSQIRFNKKISCNIFNLITLLFEFIVHFEIFKLTVTSCLVYKVSESFDDKLMGQNSHYSLPSVLLNGNDGYLQCVGFQNFTTLIVTRSALIQVLPCSSYEVNLLNRKLYINTYKPHDFFPRYRKLLFILFICVKDQCHQQYCFTADL